MNKINLMGVPVCIDLDGTLVFEETPYPLIKIFFSHYKYFRYTFKLLFYFFKGRACAKRFLVELVDFKIESLHFNQEVITMAKTFKSKFSSEVYLVTGQDQLFAEKILEFLKHENIFKECFGSNGRINLIGKEKTKFLSQHFGEKKFIYVGNSKQDIPVWQSSLLAVTVHEKGFSLNHAVSIKRVLYNFCKLLNLS